MESLVTPPGPVSPKTNGTNSFEVDPNTIVEYLANVLEIFLNASRHELERSGSLLSPESRSHTIQRCNRFASDNVQALYVTKEATTTDGLDGVLDGPGTRYFKM